MVKTGTPARYTAIAAPLLAECRPISFAEKPKMAEPIEGVASHRRRKSSVPEK